LSQGARERLREIFGDRLQTDQPLARYTSARIGGPADYLLAADSLAELAEASGQAYRLGIPFLVLGGGSNLLVADRGVRGLVILNRAKAVTFRFEADQTRGTVWAESGCSLGALARQCVQAGYGGLEWAATVPGTVGGAVYGNAGAHGSDVAGTLQLAAILHPDGNTREHRAAEMNFGYRTSRWKQGLGVRGMGLGVTVEGDRNLLGEAAVSRQPSAVVLGAEFKLERGEPAALQARVDEYVAHRKRTQPPGASIGSMFKNPPGDFAGRLIEAAGLKGLRAGEAEISGVHANFFVNRGRASAADVKHLLDQAAQIVRERFGVELEAEVELVGDWRLERGD
jgi:UDP-N-acetylmuramate dehydrogenase